MDYKILNKEMISDKNKQIHKEKGCIFLVAGRMIYRKGHNLLLDALESLPEDAQYECRIVGDGPELEKLKKRCISAELKKHVVFTGKIPFAEMKNEYENADVFVMPSIRETTGSVLLEAMSRSIPIITIRKFGGVTLLDDSTGWLYDGNTAEEYIKNLKNILLHCINHPEEVLQKGRNARKKAEQYTWHEKLKHYNHIYENLINLH